ncbi:MAG TPA: hypothetical protein VGS27_16365 [Candidatus Sulfotelmatobacter sp.]|nr:hypothetical protein [Candidatus Sulfotelmatobacter sp.]
MSRILVVNGFGKDTAFSPATKPQQRRQSLAQRVGAGTRKMATK